MNKKYESLFFVCVGILSIALSAEKLQASSGSPVVAPCAESAPSAAKGAAAGESAYQRPCKILLEGDGKIPGVKAQVNSHFETMKKQLYQGLRVDTLKTTDASRPQGLQFPKPVCDLSAGERDTNKVGESCGEPVAISVDSKKITLNFDEGHGKRETAYRSGIWVAAVSCFQSQVMSEIESSHKLTVSEECAGLGKDITSQKTANLALAAEVEKRLSKSDRATTSAELWKCGDAGAQEGPTWQSAHYLCASRTGIETAFTQLAVCEILSRAQRGYSRVLGQPDSFIPLLKKEVGEQVQSDCDSCRSLGCANSCAKENYRKRLEEFMTRKAKAFPASGGCSAQVSSITPVQAGSSGLSLLMILLFVSSLLTACGKKGASKTDVSATDGYCPRVGANVGRLPTSCCSNDGQQTKFSGDCTSASTPSLPAFSSAVGAGGIALNSAGAASRGAAALMGVNPGLASMAATAGQSGSLGEGAANHAPRAGADDAAKHELQSPGQRTAGGMADSGSGSSGLSGSSSAPLSGGITAPSGPASALLSTADGGIYTGGSGSGGRSPSSSDESGASAGGAAGLAGQHAAYDTPDTSSGAEGDPENYFSKIRRDESIFHKVEVRYRLKVIDWKREVASRFN